MARKYAYFFGVGGTFEHPADWNPYDNKIEGVAPGATSVYLPPMAGQTWQAQPGYRGGAYAFAVNVDVQFPVTITLSESGLSGIAGGFLVRGSDNVNYCGVYPGDTPSDPSGYFPQGNQGGLGGTITPGTGGGAGGPNGPGLPGADSHTPGSANGGVPFAFGNGTTLWVDYFPLGDGGYAGGNGNIFGGGAGGALANSGPNQVSFSGYGGAGVVVISWEPLVTQAALVAIMA